MIYCNAKVLMVDFNVRQTKSYPFFIEDELCEIQVKRNPRHYHYHFHINDQADTPRNRLRKQQERKYRRQTFAFFGSMALLVIVLATLGIRYDARLETRRERAMLRESARTTQAEIIARERKGETTTIRYRFTADHRSVEGEKKVPRDSLYRLFPLEISDEFEVRYVWFRPGLNEILLNQPSDEQVDRYFERAAARHAELHPELSETEVLCLVDLAFDLEGLAGLGKFYFQDVSPRKNPVYNRDAYYRLIRDVPFARERERRCW